MGLYSCVFNLDHYCIFYDGEAMNVLIVMVGLIVITAMVLKYLMWRYGVSTNVKDMQELIHSSFSKQDDRIKLLESRVDSLQTKVGAKKL